MTSEEKADRRDAEHLGILSNLLMETAISYIEQNDDCPDSVLVPALGNAYTTLLRKYATIMATTVGGEQGKKLGLKVIDHATTLVEKMAEKAREQVRTDGPPLPQDKAPDWGLQ